MLYDARYAPWWDLEAWRTAARAALRAGVAPECLDWNGGIGLFEAPPVETLPAVADVPVVPRDFLALARRVLAHREGAAPLLYRVLWRLSHGEPALMSHVLDPDIHRLGEFERAVRREMHKMKAFVRLRELPGAEESYIAWFEPEHQVLDLVAPFFQRRFANMRWAIVTPLRSVRWDGTQLEFGAGGHASDAPREDSHDALWRTYYANIFNPARLNPRMMRQEMPQRYWKHLPEAATLPRLLAAAPQRALQMRMQPPSDSARPAMLRGVARTRAPVTTAVDDLAALRGALAGCRACPLWQPATQAVAGEGPGDARVMFVGEQPGDEEDLRGRPFVGPAGRLLDGVLAELGIAREALYLTNAVKHFRFEQRGKVRLHSRARPAERAACRGWLEREIALVQPRELVCLGHTAAEAVLGRSVRLMEERGRWIEPEDPAAPRVLLTVHPSWVLRQRGSAGQAEARRVLLQDLALLRSPAADAA